MALTNAQRQTAIQAILATQDIAALSPIPSGTPLQSLLPGVSASAVLSAIVTALGTTVDTQLTTVLTSLAAILNSQLTAAQATVTSLNAQITAL